MWALFVPMCKVSGVQRNNCIVAATAILVPAAGAPSFPSVTSINKSLSSTHNHSGVGATLCATSRRVIWS